MKPAGREPGWDGHLLVLYRHEGQRRDQIEAWVRRGLEVGAKILHIAPADEPPARSVAALLGDRRDVLPAMSSGQIRVVPASQRTYDPAWQAVQTERALRRYPSVRWSGDARTAWSVMPQARHSQIEWATDEACRSPRVSVMCHYPARTSSRVLGAVSAAHGAGLREALVRAAPLPGGGLALSGELDRSNEGIVRSVLPAAAGTAGSRPFELDLSGLRFLDVDGARALLDGTDRYRRSGGRVRLRVGPRVDHLVRLLGVDRVPGILVEASR